MAFDFNTFGQGGQKPVSTGGFDFNSFGAAPTAKPTTEQNNVPFPAKEGEGPVAAGGKALLNLPSSTTNFFKSLFDMVTSPVETTKGVFQVTKGAGAAAGREILERTKLKEKVAQVPQTEDEQKARQVFTVLKDRYGSLEALQKTATEDPFSFGVDVAGILAGGAGALGKTAQLTKAAEKTAQLVTKPVGAVTAGAVEKAGGVAKFGVSQATGLTPDTISQIAKTPEAFTKQAFQTFDRNALGQAVKETIDTRINAMKSTGAGYAEIRQSPVQVKLKPGFFEETIKEKGFDIVDGKITSTTKSLTRNEADIKALQNIYDNWSGKETLTTEELLNLRSDLAEVGRYDQTSGKTSASQTMAKDLRAKLNGQTRGQVPGLEDLDREYTKEAAILKQIKKDYLQKDGSFKDGAVNKIANLTGKGKDQILARLEGIRPGITEEIKILRAIEDIDNAKGLKVGTYARAGLGIVGATTFNIPAIIGAILSTPEVAVNLIKAYGLTRNQAKKVTDIIRAMGSEVRNFKTQDAIKGFVDDFTSQKGGTPNKQGGFVRIGKETPKNTDTIKVYHAGKLEGGIKEGIFTTPNKIDAESYLKSRGGKINEFTVDKSKLKLASPELYSFVADEGRTPMSEIVKEMKNKGFNAFQHSNGDLIIFDKSLLKSTQTSPKSKVNEFVSSLNDTTPLTKLAKESETSREFLEKVMGNFDKYRDEVTPILKETGGLGEFYGKIKNEAVRSLDIEAKVNQTLKSEVKKYKTLDEFVKAKTDPTYEFKSGTGIKDSYIARGTFKEAINDIGGLKNVQKGTTNILNLRKTENINTNSQRYKKVLEEVKKGERTPLIIDENMEIMDGHHRLEAYRELGLKEIPVIAPKGTSITTYTKQQLTGIWNQANKK